MGAKKKSVDTLWVFRCRFPYIHEMTYSKDMLPKKHFKDGKTCPCKPIEIKATFKEV